LVPIRQENAKKTKSEKGNDHEHNHHHRGNGPGLRREGNLEAAYKGLKEVCMFAIEKAISRPAKSQERYLPNGEEA